MANINTYLQAILTAVYGEDVRGSIHDAIDIINKVGEVVLNTGTAVTSPTSSSTGFYENSLYLNTSTFELWKCVGTDMWASQGILKGADGATGNGIDNIAKTATVGLVDTYTITYTDGTSDTFDVTNGADGDNGNRWFRGTAISGTATLPTVYPTGIADANANDLYLNPSQGTIYHCVTGGSDTVATWAYDFTMSGGGSSVSVLNDLTDVAISAVADGQILRFDSTASQFQNVNMPTIPTISNTYNGASNDGMSGIAVKQAIDALDAPDSVVSGQYVSAVSESNGVISVSRASLPPIPTVNTDKLTISKGNINTYYYANQAGAATVALDDWIPSTPITLTVGQTSQTFTDLDTTCAYKPFIQVADGETPPTLESITTNGTTLTVTFSAITAAQAAGGAAKIKLRRLK